MGDYFRQRDGIAGVEFLKGRHGRIIPILSVVGQELKVPDSSARFFLFVRSPQGS
jgi:hypothetical protein